MRDMLIYNGEDLIEDAEKYPSREAIALYLKGFNAYKVYSSESQARKVYNDLMKVKDNGVPIMRGVVPIFTAELITDSYCGEVYVLQAERSLGHTFQFCKIGQSSSFVTRVNELESSQPGHKRKVCRALKAAQEQHVSDPQGFLD